MWRKKIFGPERERKKERRRKRRKIFSETETFFGEQISRNRDFFSETKFSETETLKKLEKSRNREVSKKKMSISAK